MRRAARHLTVTLVLGLGLVAIEALAQPGPQGLPDEAVRSLLQLALKNMQRALCEDRKPCPPATPEEFENPPISMEHARAIVLTGTRTALANWCGLDWQRRSYLPMMRHYRHTLRFNERQMPLVGLLHGIQQGMLEGQLKAKGACDEATRSETRRTAAQDLSCGAAADWDRERQRCDDATGLRGCAGRLNRGVGRHCCVRCRGPAGPAIRSRRGRAGHAGACPQEHPQGGV